MSTDGGTQGPSGTYAGVVRVSRGGGDFPRGKALVVPGARSHGAQPPARRRGGGDCAGGDGDGGGGGTDGLLLEGAWLRAAGDREVTRGDSLRCLYTRSVCVHLRTCTHMLRALCPVLRTGQRRLPPCRLGSSLALEPRCSPTMDPSLLGRLYISIYWVYALRNGSRPRLRRRWRTDGTGPTPWTSPASPRALTHMHLARAPTAPHTVVSSDFSAHCPNRRGGTAVCRYMQ